MRRSITPLALIAGFAIACNSSDPPAVDPDGPDPDGGAVTNDAAPQADGPTGDAAVPDLDAAPPGPDAGPTPVTCTSRLVPLPHGTAVPAATITGPWYRCGALGSGPTRMLRLSADGARAVVVTDAGEASVLDVPALTLRRTFATGTGRINFAGLSSDGSMLATLVSKRGEVALWDVASGALIRLLQVQPSSPLDDLGDLAFSADGARLAVATGQDLDVFEVATGAALPISARTDLRGNGRVAFAAGGDRMVVARFTYWGNGPYTGWGKVDIVDTVTGDNQVHLPYDFHIGLPVIAVSGDGTKLAIATDGGGAPIAMFDAATGAPLPAAAIDGEPIALSHDGSRLVVRGVPSWNSAAIGPFRLHQVSDGAILETLDAGTSRPAAVTPDLAHVLVGGASALVTSRALAGGATTGTACGSGDDLGSSNLAQTSGGGTLVATMGWNGNQTVHAWNTATGEEVAVPPPAMLHGPNVLSSDGTLLAEPGSENYFTLTQQPSGTVVRTIGRHLSEVTGLEFSPDDTLIASATNQDPGDRWAETPIVKVWVTATGAIQQEIESNPGVAPLFHAGGERLYVAGNGTIAVWCTSD